MYPLKNTLPYARSSGHQLPIILIIETKDVEAHCSRRWNSVIFIFRDPQVVHESVIICHE
ncbi:hypothetical protein T11_12418 [Trichinella zimbabwensis]|uniref:Uncharacterized protein n=1 Tax=Trichinella zimbabwensis TaxID=268475 RepID=A0A0V1HUY4_9BILA|nr:hypothetical protein T11_12418 [Trichinella zimbabwensis]